MSKRPVRERQLQTMLGLRKEAVDREQRAGELALRQEAVDGEHRVGEHVGAAADVFAAGLDTRLEKRGGVGIEAGRFL